MSFYKDNIIRLLRPLALALTVITIFTGVIVMAGWYLDIAWMKQLSRGKIFMNINLAFCFILAGAALLLLWHKKGRNIITVLSVIIMVFGLVSLIEHFTRWDLLLDRILFPFPAGAGVGRMAYLSSINIFLAGLALYLFRKGGLKTSLILLINIVFISSTSIIVILSYIVDFGRINEWALFSRVAVPALTGFIMISVSLLILFFRSRDYKIEIEQQMTLLLGFSAMLILFVSVNSKQRIQMLIEAGDTVEHTVKINQHLYMLRSMVTDIQSGVRAYLLVNNDNFLEPVFRAEKDIPPQLGILDSLIADNPVQLSRIKKIRSLTEKRILFSDNLIGLRDRNLDSAMFMFNTDIGRKLNDSIRTVINQMTSHEDSLLIMRNADMLRHSRRSVSVILINTAFQFLLLFAVFYVIIRYVRIRKQRFTEIEMENLNLGNKVTATSDSIDKIERKFRETLENMLEGCQIIDFNYRYLFVNEAAAQQAKVERKKLEGRLMTGLFPGIESTEMFSNLKRSMTERQVTEMDNQFVYRDGTSAWFRLKMIPVQEGVFIMSSDITNIKKAEEELLKAHSRLDLAASGAGIGIWDWDIENNNLVWDTQMYKLYGRPEDSLVTAYEVWVSSLHPDDRERSFEISQRAVRGEQEYDTEFKILLPDGSVRWLKGNGKVFRNSEGKPVRMLGVNYDITEKMLAGEKMMDNEQKYKYLFDFNPQPMWIFDVESYAFLEVNRAAIERYGYTREEFLGMTAKDIRLPEDVATLVSTVSSETKELSNTGYWRHKIKSGEIIYVEIFTHSIIFDGHRARLVLSYDITRRLKAEESLNRRIQSMEMALKYGASGKSSGEKG